MDMCLFSTSSKKKCFHFVNIMIPHLFCQSTDWIVTVTTSIIKVKQCTYVNNVIMKRWISCTCLCDVCQQILRVKRWNFILNNKYGISTVVQVETDIITSIPTSLMGQAVIMYVGTFQTDVFDVIIHLMSHWPIISFNRVDISIKVGSFFIHSL